MKKFLRDYLSRDFLEEVKKNLLAEEARLVKEKEMLTKEDPFMNPERSSAKAAEFLEQVGEELGHERIEAQKGLLDNQLSETRLALTKLKAGKYGICENCRQWIDRARLEAFPQARYCLDCEKRLSIAKI